MHIDRCNRVNWNPLTISIDDYIKLGILSDALRNYLLRLGWAHKDKEIFNLEESIKLFNLNGVGKSPSKLDMSRILSLNEHESKIYHCRYPKIKKKQKNIPCNYGL